MPEDEGAGESDFTPDLTDAEGVIVRRLAERAANALVALLPDSVVRVAKVLGGVILLVSGVLWGAFLGVALMLSVGDNTIPIAIWVLVVVQLGVAIWGIVYGAMLIRRSWWRSPR